MDHKQSTISSINHQRAIRIKFHDHSWLFHQSLKKLAVVERLFWQLGTHFSSRFCCREVAVVERFKQEPMYGLSAGTKKVAVVERWPLVRVRLSLFWIYWVRTSQGGHVGGQYKNIFLEEFTWKYSLVPRGDKCFCFWLPTRSPWRHVQTSYK